MATKDPRWSHQVAPIHPTHLGWASGRPWGKGGSAWRGLSQWTVAESVIFPRWSLGLFLGFTAHSAKPTPLEASREPEARADPRGPTGQGEDSLLPLGDGSASTLRWTWLRPPQLHTGNVRVALEALGHAQGQGQDGTGVTGESKASAGSRSAPQPAGATSDPWAGPVHLSSADPSQGLVAALSLNHRDIG